MNGPLVLAAALAVLLVVWATTGPAMLARSTAALCRAPRTAALFLLVNGALWLGALLTLALVLAWSAAGPALLPGRASELCQRCVESASPFGAPSGMVFSPAVPLSAVTLLMGVLVARALIRAWLRWRATAREVAEHLTGAEVVPLHGHRVHVLDDVRPRAFSLPTRRGGIAVSRGTLTTLDPCELAAVLEHEAAHLRQRHHLHTAVAQTLYGPLAWIPLFGAIMAAVPLYLELAADDAARRRCSTTALVSALLRLGASDGSAPEPQVALHASGSHRVHHLIAPKPVRQGLPALGLGLSQLVAAAGISAGVVLLYLSTVIAGCVV